MLLTQFSRKWREISLYTFSAELYPNKFTFNNISDLHVFSGRVICFQEESCTSRQRYVRVLPEGVIIVLPRRGMCFLWESCFHKQSCVSKKRGGGGHCTFRVSHCRPNQQDSVLVGPRMLCVLNLINSQYLNC